MQAPLHFVEGKCPWESVGYPASTLASFLWAIEISSQSAVDQNKAQVKTLCYLQL